MNRCPCRYEMVLPDPSLDPPLVLHEKRTPRQVVNEMRRAFGLPAAKESDARFYKGPPLIQSGTGSDRRKAMVDQHGGNDGAR